MSKMVDRVNLYLHARRVARREVASGRAFVVHHVGPCGEQSPSLIGKLAVPFVYGPLPGGRPANIRNDEWLSWLGTPNATAAQARLSKIVAGAASGAAHLLWRRTVRRADAITVEARANVPKGHPEFGVIPPGIDVIQFRPLGRGQPTAGRMIAVGKLFDRKGYDVLIRAVGLVVQEYRTAHLLLVGTGPQEQALRSLTSQLGIDASITFIGNVPRAALPPLLQSAEVFCHPARWDTFPLAPLEAMACGLPALVSSAGAMPEIVGEAGLVHTVGDERELARQLLRVLSTPRLRQALGIAGRARVLERFTWQAMCDSYYQLYQQLASSARES
jgi:glycosyltransferase involved in cell wall biosynthesis